MLLSLTTEKQCFVYVPVTAELLVTGVIYCTNMWYEVIIIPKSNFSSILDKISEDFEWVSLISRKSACVLHDNIYRCNQKKKPPQNRTLNTAL